MQWLCSVCMYALFKRNHVYALENKNYLKKKKLLTQIFFKQKFLWTKNFQPKKLSTQIFFKENFWLDFFFFTLPKYFSTNNFFQPTFFVPKLFSHTFSNRLYLGNGGSYSKNKLFWGPVGVRNICRLYLGKSKAVSRKRCSIEQK